MAADYILRMIEQLAAAIAGIVASKNRGDLPRAALEIEDKCLEQTGLPLSVIKQSAPDTLVALLAVGGTLRHTRGVMLAELLVLDAGLAEVRGNPLDPVNSYLLAQRLFARLQAGFAAEL